MLFATAAATGTIGTHIIRAIQMTDVLVPSFYCRQSQVTLGLAASTKNAWMRSLRSQADCDIWRTWQQDMTILQNLPFCQRLHNYGKITMLNGKTHYFDWAMASIAILAMLIHQTVLICFGGSPSSDQLIRVRKVPVFWPITTLVIQYRVGLVHATHFS